MQVYVVKAKDRNHPVVFNVNTRTFRTRDDARAECDRLNAQRRHEYEVTGVDSDAALGAYASLRAQAEAAEAVALEARRRSWEAARAAFLAGSRVLFEAHPDLRSFGWPQASEDDCGFVAWLDEVRINGAGAGCPELATAVADFLGTFDDPDMGGMFWGSRFVTVHRDGRVETE